MSATLKLSVRETMGDMLFYTEDLEQLSCPGVYCLRNPIELATHRVT